MTLRRRVGWSRKRLAVLLGIGHFIDEVSGRPVYFSAHPEPATQVVDLPNVTPWEEPKPPKSKPRLIRDGSGGW